MTCAEFEIRLCDYLDGTVPPDGTAALERHAAGCTACAELMRDARAGIAFIERAAEVEPPPELLTRILFHAPHAKAQAGLRRWLRRIMDPVLQPRLAMGMAMTILSFAMLAKFIPMRQLKAADLNPARVWMAVEDQGARAWGRTVKFYESLKFVYQIQTTVREWRQQQDDDTAAAPGSVKPGQADERRLPVNNPPAGKDLPERSR